MCRTWGSLINKGRKKKNYFKGKVSVDIVFGMWCDTGSLDEPVKGHELCE